jgi:hypothetical protein
LEYYQFVLKKASLIFPFRSANLSTAAPMLQVVIHQLGLRRLLSPVPLRLFGPVQPAKTRQVLPARAHLKPLKLKALALLTA